MNLCYYLYKEDKVYEYKSFVISKISGFDFSSKFELTINKEKTSLHIYKVERNYHVSLIEFNEKSQERVGIKIDSLETVKMFIDNYINELDCIVTKNAIEKTNSLKKIEGKKKFNSWKIKNKQKREREKFDFLKPIFITISIISIVGISFYYWYSEEYKFIFHKTEFLKAEITETKMVHFGKGYYWQKILFEYEFNNEKFKGEKLIRKSVGRRSVGDLVRLKISIENPKINKFVGYY